MPRDPRLYLLVAAMLLLALAALRPRLTIERPAWDVVVVVDITGSMNVRDMGPGGALAATSRLEAAKAAVVALAGELPCASRLGLAVFTERRPFLMIAPTPLCDGFAPVVAAVEALDWRMGWEGDSRIAAGLDRALALAADLGAGLVFLTDGHEAPPRRADAVLAFESPREAVAGLLVGVGGDAPSPIPKFDEEGREIGFYTVDEVAQETRVGAPPADAASRPGWHPRNAPWGSEAAVGNEHLSSVRTAYLEELAAATGLAAVRLADAGSLAAAVEATVPSRQVPTAVDVAALPAGLALACLVLAFLGPPVASRLAGSRRTRSARIAS